MAQSRAARLAPVVDMAERAEREAALQLGHCQGLLRQAEVQLGDLERYRGDYQQQWITEGQRGVSGQWLMNYQRFLTQLETAIGQQRNSVDWHRANMEKVREVWQQRYARLEGLRKLVKRYQDEARLAEDKREQKLLDELSQRISARDSQS
ncbi:MULTISPECIES: flagellar export protein FliJ [unclassified Pseudomonas]|jgi:flagellar protein FliJ|uniref:flagellar export protein FliJ n=1 Tax=unclassified Pseudomonas TaxID=196821 RepID=UPI001D9A54C8|nr:flagellar export protein FliJ [Pseudomonas sp.]MBU1283753.1 flagella biosynthesis chaperone FliJ [Gammaproteobacteria bacterium]MBU2157803.1 flagella biosynthesis chaperone FliJ [Gammaproteobacteria bacterium]MBU2256400.1 flagella biosynthesis chaperone FliJ [Gammaproteobacteria bacterium]MBU2293654.1 flagella biosynthesis chaperone FliJ [Gammaproteobacteria bacterium]MDO9616803.1 flagellar export protein FliJ [Pseudomonas sp.]